MAVSAKTRAKKAHARKASSSRSAVPKRRAPSNGQSAIELLEQDHREVEDLFDRYEELPSEEEKGELAKKICAALKVHTELEEEIFYPQAREATEDEDLIDESLVEHGSAKQLIEEIESMEPGDDLYDAKVKVLGEMIKHHVQEEEEELFPQVKKAKMDLEGVGKQLAERKQELMSELGAEENVE